MATQVDLLKDSAKANSKDVYKTLVAVFKEEPENPRVLADSEAFLAYTLKNGRTVRLIQRSNNMKGAMRSHTKPIHAMKFVNYRSNVAASAAEKEFFVWVVTNENPADADPATSSLSVKMYFKLQDPVTVGSFAFFINSQVNIFDVLILYDNKAAVLESSKIIPNYTSDPLEAKLVNDARELRELPQPATTKSLCSINNNGWFAFTVDPTLVAACTMRNRSTPAWAGCQGAPVLSLELLDLKSPEEPTLLMVCSTVKAFQWELTGDLEPKLLRTFWFGGSIVTMLSSRSTFVLFNDKKQVALVEARGRDSYHPTVYEIDTAVRSGSVCFNRKTSYGCVLIDAQSQVEMYQLTVNKDKDGGSAATTAAAISSPTTAIEPTTTTAKNNNNNNNNAAAVSTSSAAAPKSNAEVLRDATKPAAAEAARVASPVMDPAILSVSKELPPPTPPAAAAPTASTTSTHIRNLMEQVQRGNVRTTPATATPPTTTAAAVASPVPAARVALLQNTDLPQGVDGPLAAATHISDEAVRRELESLQNMSKNISQILKLTPDQISRDHEQLINLALEAQMTELQSAASSPPGGVAGAAAPSSAAAAGGARDANAEAFNSYAVVKVMAPIANDIARGVTHGIRNTLRTELDHAVRDALGANVREAQKRALSRRLDEVLKESTAHFSAEVRQRLADFAERDLKDVFTQVNASLSALVEENRRLQTSLNDIMRSGVLEQLQSTQQELQQLKQDIKAGNIAALSAAAAGADGTASGHGANPSTFQGARPNPETIFTTARTLLLDDAKPREALEYIALARQPTLTLRLVKEAKGDTYYGLTSDVRVPDEVWMDVLSQVSQPAALEGAADAEADTLFVAELLLDVLCERDALTTLKSAKAQGLMSNIRHFVSRQKQTMTNVEGQKVLRDLEKSIQ